ncbi:unnamed protein product [Larinioides sclopetarius]|uniref:Uncharacterized protein n=1 Tax=Larinioides sclopetarius TaxID=280406 RepID=A0AAV2BX90_9ARAC
MALKIYSLWRFRLSFRSKRSTNIHVLPHFMNFTELINWTVFF